MLPLPLRVSSAAVNVAAAAARVVCGRARRRCGPCVSLLGPQYSHVIEKKKLVKKRKRKNEKTLTAAVKSLLRAMRVVCGRACRRRHACRCGRARCCCGPCISPPRVSSVAVRVAPGPTVQSCNRKKIKLVKKRKRKNENTPKSLFHCVCRRYWRSKIVSTEAPARAAGSGFVFPWARPKPLVGRHEGPAELGPNRLGPAWLTALSRACTSLVLG